MACGNQAIMIQFKGNSLRIILFLSVICFNCTQKQINKNRDRLAAIDTLSNGVIRIDSVLQDSIGVSWYLLHEEQLSYRYYNDTNRVFTISFFNQLREEFSIARTSDFQEEVSGSTIQILDQKLESDGFVVYKCYFVSPMVIKESHIRVFEQLNNGESRVIIDKTKLKKERNMIRIKMTPTGTYFLENKILLNSDSTYLFTKQLHYPTGGVR